MNKTIVALGLLVLGSSAFGSHQGDFQFSRTYHEGDKDVYTMAMTGVGAGMSIKMTLTQVVKKVYENGDADVESSMSDMEMVANGQTMHPPTGPKAQTARVDKYGIPLGSAMSGPEGLLSLGAGKIDSLVTGTPVPFERDIDSTGKNGHIKGQVTLVSLKDGIATVTTVAELVTKPGEKAAHVESSTLFDATTHKLNHTELKITGLQGQGVKGMSTMTMTMDRKK